MLERFLLASLLAVVPPAPAYPAYLPLPEAASTAESRPPAAPAEEMPSFPIPMPRAPGAAAEPHASTTLWVEGIEDDLPSFPIPLPRPPATSDR
jgi:hypothetical protein